MDAHVLTECQWFNYRQLSTSRSCSRRYQIWLTRIISIAATVPFVTLSVYRPIKVTSLCTGRPEFGFGQEQGFYILPPRPHGYRITHPPVQRVIGESFTGYKAGEESNQPLAPSSIRLECVEPYLYSRNIP